MLKKTVAAISRTRFTTKRERQSARLIAGAGILLLLVTFVVKEMFRDQLKSMRESIVAAHGAMDDASRSFTWDAEQLQARMQVKLLDQKMSLGRASTGFVARAELSSEVAESIQAESQSEIYLDRISTVISRLPSKESVELKKVRDRYTIESRRLKQTVTDDARRSFAVHEPQPIHHVMALLQLVSVYAFDLKLISLQDETATVAKKIEEQQQRLYETCTWFSYVLYFIGWTLSAYGFLSREFATPSATYRQS